jgi:hypothetical protein
MIRFLTGAVTAAGLAGALAAPVLAQPSSPSYAQRPTYASTEETIHGRVVSFDGGYDLRVRDERGFVDNVRLHQGTVISPTGLTLAAGMTVTIYGQNRGSFFAANEIDTPYHQQALVPVYPVYPYPYWGPSYRFGFHFR